MKLAINANIYTLLFEQIDDSKSKNQQQNTCDWMLKLLNGNVLLDVQHQIVLQLIIYNNY